MSFQFVVSVLGNATKQHSRFKTLMPTSLNMCILNVGFQNIKVLCRSRTTHFHATNFGNKYLSLTGSYRQSNTFRCYCINSSEFDKQKSEDEKVMFKQDPGPVKISLSEEGLLHIKVVNNNTATDACVEKVSVEVKLLEFINCGQIDRAIELLRNAVESKKPPHLNVVISLLDKLSELGSVDTILQLEHFLLDNKLYKELYFLRSLTIAFQESGRIIDAVDYLKTLCDNNQDYSKIQKSFIYITTMILKKFPQVQSDIVSLVDRYKVSKFSQLERDLWKCFILSENFKEAENYRKNIKSFNQDQLNTDVQSILRIKHIFSDFEYVMKYLLISGEGWGLSKSLLLEIYENYLSSLSNKKKYVEVIFHLNKAKKNNIKIDHKIFLLLCHYIDLSDMTEVEKASFKSLKKWYSRPEKSERRLNLKHMWSESE